MCVGSGISETAPSPDPVAGLHFSDSSPAKPLRPKQVDDSVQSPPYRLGMVGVGRLGTLFLHKLPQFRSLTV